MERILLESSDVAVALHQLNWWRDDILKTTSEHPTLIALKQSLQKPLDPLIEIITGLAESVNPAPFPSFEEVVVHIMRTTGIREKMMMNIMDVPISAETLYEFALIFELTHYLQHFRSFVRRGIIYIGEDELRRFNVTTEVLQQYKTTPEIAKLLALQAEKIERAYQRVQKEKIPFLQARADIAFATLQEIRNSEFTILEHYIHLTPLRMWWIAYKKGI
jgi:phytoene synthase